MNEARFLIWHPHRQEEVHLHIILMMMTGAKYKIPVILQVLVLKDSLIFLVNERLAFMWWLSPTEHPNDGFIVLNKLMSFVEVLQAAAQPSIFDDARNERGKRRVGDDDL
ncbi:hypothetical protein ACJX0J_022602 [Zea mays]